jgi:hypothetical protein
MGLAYMAIIPFSKEQKSEKKSHAWRGPVLSPRIHVIHLGKYPPGVFRWQGRYTHGAAGRNPWITLLAFIWKRYNGVSRFVFVRYALCVGGDLT